MLRPIAIVFLMLLAAGCERSTPPAPEPTNTPSPEPLPRPGEVNPLAEEAAEPEHDPGTGGSTMEEIRRLAQEKRERERLERAEEEARERERLAEDRQRELERYPPEIRELLKDIPPGVPLDDLQLEVIVTKDKEAETEEDDSPLPPGAEAPAAPGTATAPPLEIEDCTTACPEGPGRQDCLMSCAMRNVNKAIQAQPAGGPTPIPPEQMDKLKEQLRQMKPPPEP